MKSKAMTLTRLLLLCAALAVPLFAQGLYAQAPQTRQAELPPPDRFLGIATLPLWEGRAPGALGDGPADVPTLTLFRPHPGSGNSTAVIVAAGGAYLGLAANLEGRQVADWFTSRGVTAFVLNYRLGRNYLYPIPLAPTKPE